MDDVRDIQLHIRERDASLQTEGPAEPSSSAKEASSTAHTPPPSMFKRWRWWLTVALLTSFVIAGQTVAMLLGRFYYNEGGSSMWMATLVQSAGSPLLIPLVLLASPSKHPEVLEPVHCPSTTKIALIYVAIGLIIAGDNLMYSYGLLYLPVSTYSLVCASQLAFNAVFSYFLNAQKFTALIFNSVVLLTFSAALLGVRSEDSPGVPRGKYPLGFMLTLGASATYSLILSLMQRTFQKVLRRETFHVVLEMQMCTSLVAAGASVVGLFASGEWRGLGMEMGGYEKGKVSYVMTLAWIAISWQVCSVGTLGLIFMVSSLFSNVISTLALPVVPIFAVVFFGDKMDGVKVVAMMIAVWGFLSYMHQHYFDDQRLKKSRRTDICMITSSDVKF